MSRLAIFTPQVGAVSESFIARHVDLLLPGDTIAFTRSVLRDGVGTWRTRTPTHEIPRSSVLRQRDRTHAMLSRFPVLRVRAWAPTRRQVGWIRSRLAESGVEVVMFEYIDVWLPLIRPLLADGVRVFGHAHGYDISERLRSRWWAQQYRAYNGTGGIITMAEASAHRLRTAGVSAERIFVAPYGIDVPTDPPVGLDCTGGAIRCLAVGRMVPKKGPLLTIRAFAAARRCVPALELTVIGSGELLGPARALARELGVEGHVQFLGDQPMATVLDRLRASHVFLQHSMVDPRTGDEEGLPIIILQAMAAGLPVLSTRHAGIPTAVESGVSGFLVEEGDVEGMTERLVDLASSPQLREEMGRGGWVRARADFSWSRERKDLLEILGL